MLNLTIHCSRELIYLTIPEVVLRGGVEDLVIRITMIYDTNKNKNLNLFVQAICVKRLETFYVYFVT